MSTDIGIRNNTDWERTDILKHICKVEEPKNTIFWFCQFFVYQQFSGMGYIPGIEVLVIFKKGNRSREIINVQFNSSYFKNM